MSILSAVYVDGFNLYYGALRQTPHRWLDLQKYFTQIRSDEEIEKIWYFTAKVTQSAGTRQQAYWSALSTCQLVKIVEGFYKRKKQKCNVRACNIDPNLKYFDTFEEKQTDVNIALQIVRDAYEKKYTNIILVSGDTDLIPALEVVKQVSPKTKITVYVPDSSGCRAYNTGELRTIVHKVKPLPTANLSKAQFPVKIIDVKGNVICTKPDSW